MTPEEQLVAAAIAAKGAGRRVFVLSASRMPDGRAEYVGIAMVDDVIADSKVAKVLSMPRTDVQWLIKDLMAALAGPVENVVDSLTRVSEKGPKA